MIKDEKGQSLVEMALIVPILLLLIVGIFDIGRITFSYASLHFTAQETVRLGGLGHPDLEMIDFAKQNFKAGDSEILTVDVTPDPTLRKSGDYITVTLNYPIEIMTPFLTILYPDPISLTVESTIRIE
jgi:Flp pilus assembly protein TadG